MLLTRQRYIHSGINYYEYIPSDFNYYEYINNNQDLENMTMNEARIHYSKYGRHENRIYNSKKLEHFNYDIYKMSSPELVNLSNDELILHYIRIGKYKIVDNMSNLCLNNINVLIPKIFHFIWVGTNKIPNNYQKYIQTWKINHPDWKIRIWTDIDLTYDNFLNLDIINKCNKMAQKADIMRYEIIYNYGGVYIDCDFESFKNIENVISNCNFFVCNGDHDCPDKKVITNALFGATIHNKISHMIKSDISKIEIKGTIVNEETGPFYFGHKLNDNFSGKFLSIYPRLFFPHTYNEFISKHNISDFLSMAYGMHHWGNSWNKQIQHDTYVKPKYIIYTSEFPNQSYGGVSIVAYNMYISLKKYYNTYVIFNSYSNPNEYILINDNKTYNLKLSEIISKIQLNSNDIFISHNCEKNNIYDFFKSLIPKCFLMCHGFYDIETLNQTLSKFNIINSEFIKRTYSANENNLSHFDNIITINPAFTKILTKKYPRKNIYYIPNCIGESNLFSISVISDHKQCNILFNKKYYNYDILLLDNIINSINPIIKFIYIGRVEDYKNINNLIEAFKMIDNCSLTLVGSNKELINTDYHNIIHVEHISNDECMKIMKNHDVLINISLTESFPMVILEAGLNKLCCYISDLPGLKTIFEDSCLYATDHLNPLLIKEDLLKIINNKNIIYEQSNKLYNLVKNNYNTQIYHQYLYQLQII